MINKKGLMAITQILILVAATFAFAYIIHENIGALEKLGVYDKENEKDNFSDKGVLLFGSLIKNLDLIPSVAAQSSQYNCCTVGGVACQNVNGSEIDRCDSGTAIYPRTCEYDNRCAGINIELAGEIASYCCPLTNEGATCQMTINTEIDEICAVPYLSTSCEATSECNLGCCIDDDFGTCTPMSTPRKCSGENVRFVGDSENDKSCVDLNLADNPCVKGCCILDGNAFYETRQACNFRAGDAYEGDPFNPEIKTEYECIAEVQKLVRGACVFLRNDGSKGCSFMTGDQCTQNGGSLAPNKLCTDQTLNTTCVPTSQTTCVEGRDEIYFVDSCNNAANIYDANMVFDESDSATVSYWNDIVSKENSCGSDSINGNSGSSTCGNCNRYLGSFCGEKSGRGYICKDLNCPASEETGDVDRLNHESWCVYDGAIGDGKDTPGSRHWKRICIDGEVRVEPCADYRGQICVESIINDELGNDFSIATCKINEAIECLNYNFQETEGDSGEEEDAARQESINQMIEQCNSNVDCFVKNVDAADKFKFDMCVPRYPRGFDLNAEERTLSDELCSIASRTCTAIKQKKLTGGWKWVANEDCTKAGFADKMNDLCISIGDCGASVNYAGELSENYQIKKSPRLTQGYIEQISKYHIPVPGQHANAPNLSDIINASGIPLNFEGSDEELYRNQTLALIRQIGTYAGAIGIVGKVIGFLGAGSGAAGSAAANAPIPYTSIAFGPGGGGAQFATAGEIAPAAASQGLSFLGALSGLGIGATVGFMAVKFFGLQGDAAVAAVVGGMLAGGVSGLLGATTFWSGGTTAFTMGLQVAFTAFIWAIIVVVIIVAIAKILGWGDIKKINVEFKCNSWEAPSGGNNCNECNDKELFPCTEYRCASLGQACVLVNEDTRFARCEEINPDDVTPPIISAGSIELGYKFENEIVNERVDIRQENGNCIPEFTFVEFDLNTDEVAQCKFGINSDMTYDEMEFSNIDTKYYFNHTFEIQMPSLDSLDVRDLEGDIIEMIGAKKLYFKCQDIQGNQNTRSYLVDLCVESGPDLTAPRIESVYPANEASLRMGVTNVNLIMNLNEPAECNFDYENLPYEEMYYNLSCSHYADEVTVGGYPCFGRIENLTGGENIRWFKCKDQPWLDDEDYTGNPGTRNTMNGYEYKLTVTENELSIDSMSPRGDIVRGFEPIILVDSEITTSGGVDNGVAQCSLSQRGYENGMVRFQHSLSNSHRQTGLQYTEGKHKLYFMCVDTVGNTAYNETNFSIRIDDAPPQVVRVLHRNGLEIITNEEAKCYYSNNDCNFNIDDEAVHSMTNVLDVSHHAPWTKGLVYYIKCEDIFGNVNGECAIQVSPVGEA